MNLRHERMSDEFEKFHIEGLPFPAAFHHFTGVDRDGPHDHPWTFTSFILYGGYVEEVYSPSSGYVGPIQHKVCDSFVVAARHIHRIVDLPFGECWTLVLPGPAKRTPRFWKFDSAGSWSRQWDEVDWTFETPW